jgi:hypothetical protein
VSARSLLCPSGPIDEPKARVLGVVGPDGQLRFAEQPIVIDEHFKELAKKGRNPNRRFRFVTPCIQNACIHWQGERCVVADIVTDEMEAAETASLPACPVRSACRWFYQRGEAACRVCPGVVADIFKEEPA